VAAQSEARALIARTLDRGFESRLRHRCLSLYFYVVLSCVGKGLATGWSLVQGVLPYVETREPKNEEAKVQNYYRSQIMKKKDICIVNTPLLNFLCCTTKWKFRAWTHPCVCVYVGTTKIAYEQISRYFKTPYTFRNQSLYFTYNFPIKILIWRQCDSFKWEQRDPNGGEKSAAFVELIYVKNWMWYCSDHAKDLLVSRVNTGYWIS
jgi:hypothetical protein